MEDRGSRVPMIYLQSNYPSGKQSHRSRETVLWEGRNEPSGT